VVQAVEPTELQVAAVAQVAEVPNLLVALGTQRVLLYWVVLQILQMVVVVVVEAAAIGVVVLAVTEAQRTLVVAVVLVLCLLF
jgi:isopentenyl diphosphate isomerase/L-lactate dehydrogenase-like FMN-dependent dehydrogenase